MKISHIAAPLLVASVSAVIDKDAICNLISEVQDCVKDFSSSVDPENCKSLEVPLGKLSKTIDDMLDQASVFLTCSDSRRRNLLSDSDLQDTARQLLEEISENDLDILDDLSPKQICNGCIQSLFKGNSKLMWCVAPKVKDLIKVSQGANVKAVKYFASYDTLIKQQEERAAKQLKLTCAKNVRGEYCLDANAKLMNITDPTCDDYVDLGCCGGTILEQLAAESKKGQKEAITLFRNKMDTCNATSVRSCLASGDAKRKIVKLRFKINGVQKAIFEKLTEEEKKKVRAAIRRDIAKKLKLKSAADAGMGYITFDANGEMVIDVQAVPETAEADAAEDLAAAFTGDLDLSDTTQALTSVGAVAEGSQIFSESLTAETGDQSNDMDLEPFDPNVSPASSSTPAYLLAASLALFVAH